MQYEDDETSLPFHNITPEQAQALIAQGAQIIDVRQPGEWMSGHIPQAELVPLDGIYLFGKALEGQPKDKELILVCEMGQRSVMAAEIALVAGYTKVYNLVGGMSAWRARRFPTER
ncbi:MAG TPA: rhodanese-like domain-containing protein [Ktedonobacterales bacterium]|nr:rhodanese-like domain-containing protein [Ktedonobacterales bacterium]